jgi:hypothetical protein
MSRTHRYRVRVTLFRDGRNKETVSRIVNARTLHEARIIAEEWQYRLLYETAGLLGLWTARCTVAAV